MPELGSYKTYLACFLAAAVASGLLVPLAVRVGVRLGLVDRPEPRRLRKRSIPRTGGVAVIAATWLTIAAVLVALENRVSELLLLHSRELLQLLVAGLAAGALGIWDDARGTNARQKLTVQTLAAVALFALGVRVEAFTVPGMGQVLLPGPLSFAVTTLWIVGLTNAFNLIDGLDGLAGGVGLCAALGMGILGALGGDVLLATVLVSLAGALAGFLCHNLPPARVYLGDGGSLFLGMTLAVAAVLAHRKVHTVISTVVPLLILGYPLLDTGLALLRRWRRGRPVFSSDMQHIHHRLLAGGLSTRGAMLWIWLTSALVSAAALGYALGAPALAVPAGLAALVLGLFGTRWAHLTDLWVRTSAGERAQLTAFRRELERLEADLGEGRLARDGGALGTRAIAVARTLGAGPADPAPDDRAAVRVSAALPRAVEVVPGWTVTVSDGSRAFREEALVDLQVLAQLVARAGGEAELAPPPTAAVGAVGAEEPAVAVVLEQA